MLAPLVTPKGYCAQSPTERHHRIVESVGASVERETCKYCGDVKDHPRVAGMDQNPFLPQREPEALPPLPDGFHWGM